jgi:hypothetical protein
LQSTNSWSWCHEGPFPWKGFPLCQSCLQGALENSEETWVPSLNTEAVSSLPGIAQGVPPRLSVSVFSVEAHGSTLVPSKGSHPWLAQPCLGSVGLTEQKASGTAVALQQVGGPVS